MVENEFLSVKYPCPDLSAALRLLDYGVVDDGHLQLYI